MALKFGESKGKAQKGVETYNYKDGENSVRLFGGILPRYVYWLKGTNNKDIPAECLAFSRDKEKFDNKEHDYVPEFFPDKKCQWSYVMMCIDPTDGKAKPINLKKKLMEQIMSAAEDGLGDPTDPDTGWDIKFRRVKTGPLAFNVEYTLQSLKCKTRSLTLEEQETISAAPTIDSVYPRPTPEEIKALLVRITSGDKDETADGQDDSAAEDTSNAGREAIKDL